MDENAKLKKLVADLSLDTAMLRDFLHRKLVGEIKDFMACRAKAAGRRHQRADAPCCLITLLRWSKSNLLDITSKRSVSGYKPEIPGL
jgi:hypothetical protein